MNIYVYTHIRIYLYYIHVDWVYSSRVSPLRHTPAYTQTHTWLLLLYTQFKFFHTHAEVCEIVG